MARLEEYKKKADAPGASAFNNFHPSATPVCNNFHPPLPPPSARPHNAIEMNCYYFMKKW